MVQGPPVCVIQITWMYMFALLPEPFKRAADGPLCLNTVVFP